MIIMAGKSKAYEANIIASVLAMSVEKNDYEQAKKEWVFSGIIEDYGEIKFQQPVHKCQMCGHQIRYGYVLNNLINGKSVTVGSECVENYMHVNTRLQLTLNNKLETVKFNAKQAKKKELSAVKGQAMNEAGRLADWIKKNGTHDEYESIFNVTYNNFTLNNAIEGGLIERLAKKYNLPVNKDKLNAFAKLHKAGKYEKL
jgi:hypothetical protein